MNGDPAAGLADYLTGRARWAALAVFAAVVGIGAALVQPESAGGAVAAVTGGIVAVGAAALLVLGQRPQLMWAVVAGAGVAVSADGNASDVGWFAVCLLTSWCVLTASRREGLLYWAAAVVLLAAEWLWISPNPGWGAWLGGLTLTAAAGLLVRHERDLVRQLREAQAGLADRARVEERNRISRELHDVLGHTLTVSLLHVQSARLAVSYDPADADRSLAEAERLGRECLAEVRGTVGLLRWDGGGQDAGGQAGAARDEAGLGESIAPLPDAAAVPALVERFRSAGAEITLVVDGDPARLPATTGLAVYRILQEALTNAARHAPGTPTAVRLAVGPGAVTLTADSVTGPRPQPGPGTGLGLISMRERAEALGGRLEAGPGGRGWLVHATLPLDPGREAVS